MPSNDTSGLNDTGITIRPRQPNPLIARSISSGRLQSENQQNTNLNSYNQINCMSGNTNTIGDTGITIRQRRDRDNHRQSVQASDLANHGIARRRLCLQARLDIGTMSCPPIGSVKPDEIEVGHHFIIIMLFGIYISLFFCYCCCGSSLYTLGIVW
jgi:hypothetical protein